MAYFTFDIINFDQSALAAMIAIIVCLPFLMMPMSASNDYKTARAFFLQRAHEMAVKIVKWVGSEFRLIIGQVFSGLFLTSWLDTVYMLLSDIIVKMEIYERLKTTHPKTADKFKRSFLPVANYGDDSVRGVEMKYVNVLLANRTEDYPLGDYQRLMESLFGMAFKKDQTYLYLPDATGISPFVTLICHNRDVNGKILSTKVTRPGPTFLKRQFITVTVRGRKEIVPWRHENDFYSRTCISATADPDKLKETYKWRSKFLGLMIDTMGTNVLAYDAMRSMYIGATKGITAARLRQDQTRLKLREIDCFDSCNVTLGDLQLTLLHADERTKKVMHRTGLNENEVFECLSHKVLLGKFLFDEEWRHKWALQHGIWLYDGFGRRIYPHVGHIKLDPTNYVRDAFVWESLAFGNNFEGNRFKGFVPERWEERISELSKEKYWDKR
jgi:hypothetical protein